MAYLQYIEPTTRKMKKVNLVFDSNIIGRHPLCEVILNGNSVSREHARIVKGGQGFFLEDLMSRNGTLLNNKPVTEKARLYDGDIIRISDLAMTFHSDNPEDIAPLGTSEHQNVSAAAEAPMIIDNLGNDFNVNITSQIYLGQKPRDVTVMQGLSNYDPTHEIQILRTRLHIMLELSKNLGKIDELKDLLPRFLGNLLRLFPNADSVCIVSPNKDTNQLELVGYKRRNERDKSPFRISRSILEKTIVNKSGILSDDIMNDSVFKNSSSVFKENGGSFMAVPIFEPTLDRLIGIVQIESATVQKSFNQDDLELMVSVTNQLALYYENIRLQEIRTNDKMISRELSVAHKVQQGFLPNEQPKLENYAFFDYYRPAKFIGGDYYDYIVLPEGKLAIAIGDVAGKGISAALLMAKLSAEVRYSLLLEKSFPDVMKRLNDIYSNNYWDGRFITFQLIVIDPEKDQIHLLNAGHVYPILSHTDGSFTELGESITSFPLGVTSEARYDEYIFTLKEKETLAMMSDGLTDAMNSTGDYFTLTRVKEYLKNPNGLLPDQLGDRLMNEVRTFVGQTTQSDDQCLVIFGKLKEQNAM